MIPKNLLSRVLCICMTCAVSGILVTPQTYSMEQPKSPVSEKRKVSTTRQIGATGFMVGGLMVLGVVVFKTGGALVRWSLRKALGIVPIIVNGVHHQPKSATVSNILLTAGIMYVCTVPLMHYVYAKVTDGGDPKNNYFVVKIQESMQGYIKVWTLLQMLNKLCEQLTLKAGRMDVPKTQSTVEHRKINPEHQPHESLIDQKITENSEHVPLLNVTQQRLVDFQNKYNLAVILDEHKRKLQKHSKKQLVLDDISVPETSLWMPGALNRCFVRFQKGLWLADNADALGAIDGNVYNNLLELKNKFDQLNQNEITASVFNHEIEHSFIPLAQKVTASCQKALKQYQSRVRWYKRMALLNGEDVAKLQVAE
ncbi:MAG: hypothetical protein UU47_C0009G0012 [candidate division TM6 bacterium GW2011_GWE2_41_16]|nr:MAG: hypothetical protein UU47_C0009G0012 [candidate division TM6 bacterium GW2011_GWE2_41_16]